jgi:hypothetical protein
MFRRKKRRSTLKVLFVDLDTVNYDNLFVAISGQPIAVVHRKGAEPFLLDLGTEMRTA